jgi:acyl carrier protein
MSATRADVEQTVRSFLERAQKPADVLADDTPLYSDGIGLDSLETAELSAVLEDTYGSDPFQGESMPQTVGDILAFYDAVANSATTGA